MGLPSGSSNLHSTFLVLQKTIGSKIVLRYLTTCSPLLVDPRQNTGWFKFINAVCYKNAGPLRNLRGAYSLYLSPLTTSLVCRGTSMARTLADLEREIEESFEVCDSTDVFAIL